MLFDVVEPVVHDNKFRGLIHSSTLVSRRKDVEDAFVCTENLRKPRFCVLICVASEPSALASVERDSIIDGSVESFVLE